MRNLAPFTPSLNKRHSDKVEEPIKRFLDAKPPLPPLGPNEERVVDYRVEPIYGNPTSVAINRLIGEVQTRMRQDLFLARPRDAAGALVRLGFLAALEEWPAQQGMLGQAGPTTRTSRSLTSSSSTSDPGLGFNGVRHTRSPSAVQVASAGGLAWSGGAGGASDRCGHGLGDAGGIWPGGAQVRSAAPP
jgi:hypothetical protein